MPWSGFPKAAHGKDSWSYWSIGGGGTKETDKGYQHRLPATCWCLELLALDITGHFSRGSSAHGRRGRGMDLQDTASVNQRFAQGTSLCERVQPITYLAINCQARQVTCPEEQPVIPHRDGPPWSCEPGQAAKRGPGGVGGVWPRWDQGSSVCASLPVSEQPGSSPLIPPLFSNLLSPRALDYFSLQRGLCSCPTATYSHRVEHNGEYS